MQCAVARITLRLEPAADCSCGGTGGMRGGESDQYLNRESEKKGKGMGGEEGEVVLEGGWVEYGCLSFAQLL